MAVAVVERFKKRVNAMYGLSAGTKKLAVVEKLFWKFGSRFSDRCRCREV